MVGLDGRSPRLTNLLAIHPIFLIHLISPFHPFSILLQLFFILYINYFYHTHYLLQILINHFFIPIFHTLHLYKSLFIIPHILSLYNLISFIFFTNTKYYILYMPYQHILYIYLINKRHRITNIKLSNTFLQ